MTSNIPPMKTLSDIISEIMLRIEALETSIGKKK